GYDALAVPPHSLPAPGTGPAIVHFAQMVGDEHVVADPAGDQRQQISGADLSVLAAEPLGPALDPGRPQRRCDPGDASSDPPRPNGRSADAFAGGSIGADAEDEEGEAGRREDELTASGHLGGGHGQGPEGA